jgi:hypothetical protein
MKYIEEPNLDWSSEFEWIHINYYEDQCNSIELQAIELSSTCVRVCACACVSVSVHTRVCVCVHMCMCYVLCVLWTLCLIYSILDFQIGKTEEASGCFRFSIEKNAWHVYNVCPWIWLFWKGLFTARHTCWTKVSDIKKRIGIYT